METQVPFPALIEQGLNLQAVLNLKDLSGDLRSELIEACAGDADYSQLILIGHGGTKLWSVLKSKNFQTDDPIDDFSIRHIDNCLKKTLGENTFEFLYPGEHLVGLQSLGSLAGWHNPSLLRIGILKEWGTWFAYRAVVLARSSFGRTKPIQASSICDNCVSKACVAACPPEAVTKDNFRGNTCFSWRAKENSPCARTCLARLACPIAKEHTYSEEQQAYHYGLSLGLIKRASPG